MPRNLLKVKIGKKSKTVKVCADLAACATQNPSSRKRRRKLWNPDDPLLNITRGQNMLPVYVPDPLGTPAESPWSPVEPPICICLSLKATWGTTTYIIFPIYHVTPRAETLPYLLYITQKREVISEKQKGYFYQGCYKHKGAPKEKVKSSRLLSVILIAGVLFFYTTNSLQN